MANLTTTYVPVCNAIAQLLKPHAEVVLHDLAAERIAYIANSFSKRRAGDSSLNDPEATPSLTDDVIGPYPKANWDGRQLKSITAVLRDARRRPIGLLCINYDISVAAGVLEHLAKLIEMPERATSAKVLLSKDWREGVNAVVGTYLNQRKATLAGLTNTDVDELIGALDRQGIFDIRKAVPYVAEVLGLSRATIYNRLATVRRLVSSPRRKL
jgi:D-arginine utilization repressor